MSSAKIVDVADQVVALLNVPPSPFSQQIAAKRTYLPEAAIPVLNNNIQVIVMLNEDNVQPLSRKTTEMDVRIDVGVRKLVDNIATPEDECDELMGLMQEIQIALEVSFPPPIDAHWTGTERKGPPYHQDRLRNQGVFLSVSTFTFKSKRPR